MMREVLGYIGLVLIVAGVWGYSRPAALIVAGLLVVVVAVFGLPDERKADK